jgi:hypothetical protein
VLVIFPPLPAVVASGSPLTVARPSRFLTGFLARERFRLYCRSYNPDTCHTPRDRPPFGVAAPMCYVSERFVENGDREMTIRRFFS